MNHLNRAVRQLKIAYRNLEAAHRLAAQAGTPGLTRDDSPELIPFCINIPAADVPPWVRPEELEATVREALVNAVTRLAGRMVTPGQLLARKNVPAELRSQAAHSMLAMRGGRATAAKMRVLGYPNLLKAREALQRKAAERRSKED